MGLDIYAGTLTRYYSHNWKTVVQQWAEENGYTFRKSRRRAKLPTMGNLALLKYRNCGELAGSDPERHFSAGPARLHSMDGK